MYLNTQYCYDGMSEYANRVWPDIKKAFWFAVIFGGFEALPFEATKHISDRAISEGIMLIALTSFLFASMTLCGLALMFRSRKTHWFGRWVIKIQRFCSGSAFSGVSWLMGVILGLMIASLLGSGTDIAAVLTILVTAILLHVFLLSMDSLVLGRIKLDSIVTVRFLAMLLFLGGLASYAIFPWMKY